MCPRSPSCPSLETSDLSVGNLSTKSTPFVLGISHFTSSGIMTAMGMKVFLPQIYLTMNKCPTAEPGSIMCGENAWKPLAEITRCLRDATHEGCHDPCNVIKQIIAAIKKSNCCFCLVCVYRFSVNCSKIYLLFNYIFLLFKSVLLKVYWKNPFFKYTLRTLNLLK